MNLGSKRAKPRKIMQPAVTVRGIRASQEGRPIVISQVNRTEHQGREVFIVVKHNDGKMAHAEVKIVAPPEEPVDSIERVRRDVKNIISAIEVVNKKIETDEKDRQRLLSMCMD